MENKIIRWGILSTAKIAREKVIPALQKSDFNKVMAICSRNLNNAKSTAESLNIPTAYGTYEELLADNELDAVYIPLPNHMHVAWAIKAMNAGKHVLLEKPIGLNAAQAQELLNASKEHPNLKVMEGFMYRFHQQWQQVKSMVLNQKIGELKTVHSFFSYNNANPDNIRNIKEAGGGGMMDIGCYCISLSRFLFEAEPLKVVSMLQYNEQTETDTLASGMLQFSKGTATFTCSTQLMPYQRVQILGDKGRIEIEIPFNPLPNERTKINLFTPSGNEEFTFEPMDQYTKQMDSFAMAILNQQPVYTNLQDGVNNMIILDAIVESSRDQEWKVIDNFQVNK